MGAERVVDRECSFFSGLCWAKAMVAVVFALMCGLYKAPT